MKLPLFLLFSAGYVFSQCQANPAPNPSDPQDPKTVCIGPLGTTSGAPGAYRFQIGGTDPVPQKGYVWLSVATGKVMESDDGGAYHSLVGPTGAPGTNGTSGINGKDGLPGKDGANSTVPGPQGIPGVNGTNGLNGKDSTVPGPQGIPGVPGASVKGDKGDPGTPGINGTNGIDGKDGLPGKNGADSTVPGPIGPQGVPGAAASVSNLNCVINSISFSPPTISLSCH